MSSIYKKGRDGYYYYQAYVYSNKSKKNDKRIFHSLSTKDVNVAKQKQIELDKKYKKNIIPKKSFINKYKTFFTFERVILFTLILYTASIFFSKKNIKVEKNNVIKKKKISIAKDQEKKEIEKFNSINAKIVNEFSKKEKVIIEDKEINYKIVRIDKSSDQFQLGKFFIIIDPESSEKSRIMLCKRIVRDFSEFSNIVVCLYSNNTEGTALAKGVKRPGDIEIQKKYWLGMFTYNLVEGEYYDENPTKFFKGY